MQRSGLANQAPPKETARGGRGLAGLRRPMEALFHQDFGSVRIHRDGLADASGARAVTVGDHIHLSSAEPDLSSSAGVSLVAHELAHVIQQRRPAYGQERGAYALEREADEAARLVVAGASAKVDGKVAGAGPAHQPQPKLSPAPPSGNILYVGMNNADPEIAALQARYRPGSPIGLTVIKGTKEEAATTIGGPATFDLTSDAGIDALAAALTTDTAKRTALATIIKGLRDPGDRDDFAHVAKVYADTEADGKDRMTRVVLSGHSGGLGVFGSSGEIYFSALVKLAAVFPGAAGQTKHLIVAGCHTGDEDTILNYYVKAYPSLLTVWAWWDACPTGAGAASAIVTWAGLTEHGETKLPRQGGGMATWSGGVYEGNTSGKASAASVLTSIHADDARFQEYVDGTRADAGPHGGWLEGYYLRVLAATHRADITGSDHTDVDQRRQRALLLRFWPSVAKRFWDRNKATITKGYGSATVPDYPNLSRKNTLKAITDFATVTTAADPDKSAAAKLLDALKNLDPINVPESMAAE